MFLLKGSDLATPPALRSVGWRHFLAVAGPGIVVMLADTDAGSIITAAQSGAQWGYQLLLLQLVLVPILYIVQELTVRLGLVTRKGRAELKGAAPGLRHDDDPDKPDHQRRPAMDADLFFEDDDRQQGREQWRGKANRDRGTQ